MLFYVDAGPLGTVLRSDITLPDGSTEPHSFGASFTPGAPGCYVASARVTFASGQVLTASHAVSVGGVSCGGGG